MKNKKNIFLLLILIIIGINSQIFAFELLSEVNLDKTKYKEVEITLKISDIKENVDGVNVIYGKFIYDKNIFEDVQFNGINNWTAVYNNEENNENEGKFIIITTSGNATEEKSVAKVNFKLKSNIINETNTQIKFEGNETSYHSEKITMKDNIINLNIKNNNIKVVRDNLKNNKFQNMQWYKKFFVILLTLIILIIIIIKVRRIVYEK